MSEKQAFDLRRGIVGFLAAQDFSKKQDIDVRSGKPVDRKTKNVLEEISPNELSLDDLILERLCPVIKHKAILSPSSYESLLLSAIDSLNDMSRDSGETAHAYCSDMLKYELRMVEYINTQKRASKWM